MLFHQWISWISLLVWIALCLSTVLNYYLSCETNPGYIKKSNQTYNSNAAEMYCTKCQSSRPNRAHHCRKCDRCILRMDHHCYWIDSCVGFYNQGHFLRMIVSASLFCTQTDSLLICFLYNDIYHETGVLTISQV